jgi:beta-glucosidase
MDNKNKFIFMDPDRSLQERIDALISEMTMEEKISQLLNDSVGIDRLNIPQYNWWSEALHGVGFAGTATVFPQAIGLAASFDVDLIKRVARTISEEGRAKHHEAVRKGERQIFQGLTFWSPNVNIFRDPRWGRGQETYGEDPHLTSRMGVAFVKGLQGDDPKYLKTVATPKHYVAYSGLESERHFFDAKVSNKDLWETYLPAFEACIVEGNAEAIMGAYNRINGEPCCASPFLLDTILRKKWGFKGHVVSDCGAIRDIFDFHKYVNTPEEAAGLAIKSGCDLFCCIQIKTKAKKKLRWSWIAGALKRGIIQEDHIDRALRRLFRARFLLGMFDPPDRVKYAQILFNVNDCEDHRRLSLDAARKSIVLLKNENLLLPVPKNLKRICVIGPNADNKDVLLGNYNGEPSRFVTILQGIKQRSPSSTEIVYAQGCPLKAKSEEDFTDAINAVNAADIVIAVLGLSPRLEGEEGEAAESDLRGDRIDLDLPGDQEMLLKTINELGKPVILVLTGGSAISINYAQENVPGIIEAWYPGEEGGLAVADVIYGDYNPAGRLPITFYKSISQLPDFRSYAMEGRTYRYFEGTPLYYFGHGLSYTKFEYTNLNLNKEIISKNENLIVKVDVQNVGNMGGEEVVQLYLKNIFTSFRIPNLELKRFCRIKLLKNEKKTIKFTLDEKDHELVNMKGERVILPRSVVLSIGGCQPGFQSISTSVLSSQYEII